MITAIVPAYNAERTIGRTLSAILGQTVPPDRILVVNDGSTDGTLAEVARAAGRAAQVISQPNAGVAAARNRGAREAQTDVIAFCDADDEWCPRFLETIARLARTYPDASVYATAYRIVPPDGPSYDARLHGLPFAGQDGMLSRYFEVASQSDPPIHSSAVAMRRDALIAAGSFPEGIRSGEDLLTWARLALQFQIAYSRAVSATFHHPERMDFSRPSDDGDPVGAELQTMLEAAPSPLKPGLRRYLARWHEMRAIIALGQRFPARARGHMLKVFRYYRPTPRRLALAAMAVLPGSCSFKLFAMARSARRSG